MRIRMRFFVLGLPLLNLEQISGKYSRLIALQNYCRYTWQRVCMDSFNLATFLGVSSRLEESVIDSIEGSLRSDCKPLSPMALLDRSSFLTVRLLKNLILSSSREHFARYMFFAFSREIALMASISWLHEERLRLVSFRPDKEESPFALML